MSTTSDLAKQARDHLPYSKDQGIQDAVGTRGRGVSIQSVQTTVMVAVQLEHQLG